jgi:hypothetical protein
MGDDGQEKTRWNNVGVVFKSEKGSVTMKLEYTPIKRNDQGDLWLNLFSPDKKKQPAQQGGFRDKMSPDEYSTPADENIPF